MNLQGKTASYRMTSTDREIVLSGDIALDRFDPIVANLRRLKLYARHGRHVVHSTDLQLIFTVTTIT